MKSEQGEWVGVNDKQAETMIVDAIVHYLEMVGPERFQVLLDKAVNQYVEKSA